MATLNLLNLNENDHFCLELRTKAPMTLWLADHHTNNAAGAKELVFTPREVDANTPVLVDNELQVYTLVNLHWYHARVFNVAINVDRFLLYTKRSNRQGIARVLPINLCLTNGTMVWVPQKGPINTPVLAATRQIGQAAHRKYQAGAMMMKSMYDSSEWQMLSHPSCIERSMLQAA